MRHFRAMEVTRKDVATAVGAKGELALADQAKGIGEVAELHVEC
jgi:hypothetical protein